MLSSRSVAVMVSLVAFGLAQQMREDRDGRLALDDALRQIQLRSRSNFFTLNSIAGFPPLVRATCALLYKPVTVPFFREGIKTVVVAVAVETRKTAASAVLVCELSVRK